MDLEENNVINTSDETVQSRVGGIEKKVLDKHNEAMKMYKTPGHQGVTNSSFKVLEPRISVSPNILTFTDLNFLARRSINAMTSDERNIYCSFIAGAPEEYMKRLPFCDEMFRRQEIWRYNLATFTWTNLDVIGIRKYSTSLILHKGNLIYMGMDHTLCKIDLSQEVLRVETFETTGQKWFSYGIETFFEDTFYYVSSRIGDSANPYNLDVHKLNINTLVWEALYIAPVMEVDDNGLPRWKDYTAPEMEVDDDDCFDDELPEWVGYTVSKIENKLYVLGGYIDISKTWDDFHKIKFFDLDQKVWSLVSTERDPDYGYPTNLSFLNVCNSPNRDRLIMVGGFEDQDKKTYNNCTWRFDEKSLSWKKMTSMQLSVTLSDARATVTPTGKLYVFGPSFDDPDNFIMQMTWVSEPPLLTLMAYDKTTITH